MSKWFLQKLLWPPWQAYDFLLIYSAVAGVILEKRVLYKTVFESFLGWIFCFCFGEQILWNFSKRIFWNLMSAGAAGWVYICSLAVCAYWLQQSFNMCTAAAYASWLSCFCKALINRPRKMKPQLLAPGLLFFVFFWSTTCAISQCQIHHCDQWWWTKLTWKAYTHTLTCIPLLYATVLCT